MIDHLTGWPGGGFAGVDVFFVISGFLITGVLLREHDRTGRISFVDFYRRRIKRIIPAAWLVLAVTLVGSRVIFARPRFDATLTDGWWTLAFGANWHFAAQGTDYFDANRAVSPLQHYWSLAVEEQFYFVWPWLLLVVLALVLRRGVANPRVVAGALVAAISVASFGFALWQTVHQADAAYFSTWSRAWELGVGALLAAAAPAVARRLERLPVLVRPAVAWVGLSGIVASLWLIGSQSAVPAPGMLLPVLSSALVIAAGTGIDQQRFLAPLTNRVSGYLGDISYSLYLWHFPVIILGGALVARSPLTLSVLGLVSVVAAAFAYELVEDPVRRSSWLGTGSPLLGVHLRRGRRVPAGTRAHPPRTGGAGSFLTPRYKLTASCLAATLLVGGLATVSFAGQETGAAPGVELSAGDARQAMPTTQRQRQWRTQILEALRATSWPRLKPTMDDVIDSPQAAPEILPCGVISSSVDTDQCTWGSASAQQHAIVVGDSVSMTYVAPLRQVLQRAGSWSLTSYGTFGCPFVDLQLGDDQATVGQCRTRRRAAVRAIARERPDVVFVANAVETPAQFGSGNSVSEEDWTRGVGRELTQAGLDRSSNHTRVVFVAPPPGDVDLDACYTRLAHPADCVGTVSDDWYDRASSEQALARRFHGTWVDSSLWFCTADRCPSFIDGVPVKSDAVHMSIAFGNRIEPLLAQVLHRDRVLYTKGGRFG